MWIKKKIKENIVHASPIGNQATFLIRWALFLHARSKKKEEEKEVDCGCGRVIPSMAPSSPLLGVMHFAMTSNDLFLSLHPAVWPFSNGMFADVTQMSICILAFAFCGHQDGGELAGGWDANLGTELTHPSPSQQGPIVRQWLGMWVSLRPELHSQSSLNCQSKDPWTRYLLF